MVVVVMALITKNLNRSLIASIIIAALISTHYAPLSALKLLSMRVYQQITDIDKLYLYLFLILIASLISLYNHTGCINTFGHLITRKVKSSRTIQMSSLLLSCCLFIDDYLSILTTGFVMSPLMDRFGIPRLKLAFLVHALAGAVVILAPLSSWVGTIIGYLTQAGIDTQVSPNTLILADPFYIHLRTLPFMFYSFLIIASAWFIVRQRISYGPMHTYEETTKPTEPTPSSTHAQTKHGSVGDLIIPLLVLIGTMFGGILYTGKFFLLGGTNSFIEALKQSGQVFLIMFLSSALAFIIGIIRSLKRGTLVLSAIPRLIIEGALLMRMAIIMVFLAAILGALLKEDLLTGQYLAQLLIGSVPLALFPALFFITSLITSTATGSSWTTFALMLSVAVPMLTSFLNLPTPVNPSALPILFPILGAIFSGAVCGDHISPISETTTMTATSTGTTPLMHAYTQIFYALPACICTLIGFIVSGYLIAYPLWINLTASLSISISFCFITLTLLNRFKK
jgi:Na+/H+ antiporter NhaC